MFGIRTIALLGDAVGMGLPRSFDIPELRSATAIAAAIVSLAAIAVGIAIVYAIRAHLSHKRRDKISG